MMHRSCRGHGKRRSVLATLVMAFVLSACGGGGASAPPAAQNTPPANVALVEASSDTVGGLSVSWLSASDGSTPGTEIQYQVHASTSADFVPDSSTVLFDGRGATSAVLTGLTPGAQYAVRLVAIDREGARTISSPLTVRVSSVASGLQAGVVVQPLAPTQASVVSDKLVSLAAGVAPPVVGQYIASDDGEGYLKQVMNVTTASGQTLLETRDASISEVVSDVEVSSSFRMLGIPQEVETAALTTGLVVKPATRPGGSTDYWWKDTGFRYSAASSAATAPTLFSGVVVQRPLAGMVISATEISTSGAWGKISAPSNVAISEDEPAATFKLTASVVDRSKPVIGTPVSICRVDLGALWGEGEGSNPSGISVTRGALEVVQSVQETGVVVTARQPITVKATRGTANIAPYKVKATVYFDDSGDGCSGDNMTARWRETLDLTLEILVVNNAFPETESVAKTFDGTAGFKVANDVVLKFSPTVSFDQRLSGARLQYAKIEVSAAPRVEQTLRITATAAGTVNKTVDLITPRKFYKVYVAGGVPIVVSGTYRLKMHITGDASGEIDATEKLTIGYDQLNYGIKYENGVYSEIKNVQPVYRLNIGGNGQAEANLEFSLQPSMEVTAYKAVTGQVMLEPYLAAHAGIEGHVQLDTEVDFNTLQTNMATDADYRLTRGELGGGTRAYLYADFHVWDRVLAAWPPGAKADDYQTHRQIDLVPETPFLGLPALTGAVDWDARHPTDSRAILVKAAAANVANPLKAMFSGLPDAFVTWAAWTNPRIVPQPGVPADSYGILPPSTGKGGEAWVVLKHPATYTVRQGGYSNWGTWARQYVETTLDVLDANANGIPDWWEARYGLAGATGAAIANADPDGDGASNLQEWQAGSNPSLADAPPLATVNVNPRQPGLLEVVTLWISEAWAGVKGVVWSFASGAADLYASVANGTSAAVTTSFSSGGEQAVTVTYKDADGSSLGQSFFNIVVDLQPGIAQFSPTSSLLNAPTVFTVSGSGLPLTAVLAIQDAECEPPATQSVAGFTQRCTPRAAGTKAVTIKDAPGGLVLSGTYRVQVTDMTPAATHPLNDTGIDGYADATTGPSLATEPADFPGQDAKFGRDAQARAGVLVKVGGGGKGFDFSKIANNGSVLPESAALGTGANDWACTRDNVTGLVWEVKAAAGLRGMNHTYTWYSRDAATNGGLEGTASGGICETAGRCDTEKYIVDVNATALCGYADWRMPTRSELESIVDYGRIDSGLIDPAIDPIYFPNTANITWSASVSYVYASEAAKFVTFIDGSSGHYQKNSSHAVRAVRGAH